METEDFSKAKRNKRDVSLPVEINLDILSISSKRPRSVGGKDMKLVMTRHPSTHSSSSPSLVGSKETHSTALSPALPIQPPPIQSPPIQSPPIQSPPIHSQPLLSSSPIKGAPIDKSNQQTLLSDDGDRGEKKRKKKKKKHKHTTEAEELPTKIKKTGGDSKPVKKLAEPTKPATPNTTDETVNYSSSGGLTSGPAHQEESSLSGDVVMHESHDISQQVHLVRPTLSPAESVSQ